MDAFESIFLSLSTQTDSDNWRLYAPDIVIQLAESRMQTSHQMAANSGERDVFSTSAEQENVHGELEIPSSKMEPRTTFSDADEADLETLKDTQLYSGTSSSLSDSESA